MLQITIPAIEMWDERIEKFISLEEQTLELEHSLVSVSKWESTWRKAFLGREKKTDEETLDYIKCMTLTPNVDPDIYNYLSEENYRQINDYIQDPMTATTFVDDKSQRTSRKVITTEVIYSWMFSLQIPKECETWHLNRLMTQIRTCSVMNQTPKKMSKKDVMAQNAALNAARRQKLNSKG